MSTENINYLLNHYKSSYGIKKNDQKLHKLIVKDHERKHILYLKGFAKLL